MEKKSVLSHKNLFIFLAIGALFAFYYLFDPLQTVFMPQCVFHKVTGLQCMGCGSQRMVHAILHGDLQAAFQANAFIFCCIPFLFFMLILELNRKRWSRIYSAIHSRTIIITITAMLIAWLFIRNFLGI